MLRLYLLRHAKSSWANPSLADFDRPLNKRGKKDLPNIANYLIEKNHQPDRILCSSAQRTRETLAGILPGLTRDASIQLLSNLYEGNAPDYLILLRQYALGSKDLMIIGHNTGMEEIALKLLGNGEPDLVAQIQTKFPTGALAVLTFPFDDWNDVTTQTGYLTDFAQPRNLIPPSNQQDPSLPSSDPESLDQR